MKKHNSVKSMVGDYYDNYNRLTSIGELVASFLILSLVILLLIVACTNNNLKSTELLQIEDCRKICDPNSSYVYNNSCYCKNEFTYVKTYPVEK